MVNSTDLHLSQGCALCTNTTVVWRVYFSGYLKKLKVNVKEGKIKRENLHEKPEYKNASFRGMNSKKGKYEKFKVYFFSRF